MTVKNASILPRRYYGLHMVEGVAEYVDPETKQPYRILLREQVLKDMDATMEGKPLYVKHVDEVDLANLETQAAGVVVRSFFNPPDGKHWVEFMVTSDQGHEAIRSGWVLSNAYLPKSYAAGGLWHAVEYAKEVMRAEYEHLALVPNPRYEESIVLTPEEFRSYNEKKEAELARVANAKETSSMKFWKKTKVDNAADLENTVVSLANGKEMTVAQVINGFEEHEKKADPAMKQMANMEHMVKCGDSEMTVNELLNKYNEMVEKMKSAADPDAEAKKKAEEIAAHEAKELEAKKNAEKEAADKAAAEKKANEEKAAAEKKENERKEFERLKNAANNAPVAKIETSEDRLARGKARYGSGN